MNDDRPAERPGEDAAALAEVRSALARAGLTADTRQLAALVASHQRLRPALEALRARLAQDTEPAAVFRPGEIAGRPDPGAG